MTDESSSSTPPHTGNKSFQKYMRNERPGEEVVIEKLERVADDGGGFVEFSEEEAVILRKVVKWVRGVEALGWMGTGFKTILVWLVGLLVVWSQLGDWISVHLLGKGS